MNTILPICPVVPYRLRLQSCALPFLLLAPLVLSCKRETREVVITDTAEVRRIEAVERVATQVVHAVALNSQLEIKRAEAEKASRDLQAAQANEQAAKDKLLKEQATLARERLAHEKELADQERALKEEVAAIATASETISVFVAELRNRIGELEIKQKRLPSQLALAHADAAVLLDILTSHRQGVVTNVSYFADGKAAVEDIHTVTRKPDEYVKAIKSDARMKSIMARYNNDMIVYELDKVVQELDHENKRLKTSWDVLGKSKTVYGDKLNKANQGTRATGSGITEQLAKVTERIKFLEMQLRSLQNGMRTLSTGDEIDRVKQELGRDGSFSSGLYTEQQRLQRMLELSSNTEQHADASSAGIKSNFALQEKALRDEYEANVRRAFENVERAVMNSVAQRKDELEKEATTVKKDLASIKLIIDAHTRGRLSRSDMMNLHAKWTNSVSRGLESAAVQLLGDTQ